MVRHSGQQEFTRQRIIELLAKDLKPAQIARRCGCRVDLVRAIKRRTRAAREGKRV